MTKVTSEIETVCNSDLYVLYKYIYNTMYSI